MIKDHRCGPALLRKHFWAGVTSLQGLGTDHFDGVASLQEKHHSKVLANSFHSLHLANTSVLVIQPLITENSYHTHHPSRIQKVIRAPSSIVCQLLSNSYWHQFLRHLWLDSLPHTLQYCFVLAGTRHHPHAMIRECLVLFRTSCGLWSGHLWVNLQRWRKKYSRSALRCLYWQYT
jgi:hypothetical protein